MLYTSGTTGKPKGVPRRHRADAPPRWPMWRRTAMRDAECTLGVMPLYHTMGVRSLLALALIDGRIVCIPRFDAEPGAGGDRAEQVTHLYLVPTLYHDLLSHPHFAGTDVRSVRKLGFAGAPMHDALLQRCRLLPARSSSSTTTAAARSTPSRSTSAPWPSPAAPAVPGSTRGCVS
jgi:2-furoate---CoA ligase